MTAQQPTKSEIQSLVSLIQSNTLLNRQLQSICQINGLKGSGVKADLQRRIVEQLPYNLSALLHGVGVSALSSSSNFHAVIYQSERDRSRFQQIKSSIDSIKSGNQYYPNAHSSTPPIYAASRTMNTYSQSSTTYPAAGYPASGHSNSYRPNSGFSHHASRTGQSPSPWLQHVLTVPGPGVTFKPSPFYEPKTLVADVRVCDVMAHHRNTVTISLKAHELGSHLSDPSIRILVFCSTADTGVQDIAFPYQSDLKVNGGEVKANLRGLKNKPGSTRPVDITDQLRLRPAGYINNVEFTYALTDKGRVPSKKKETQRYYISIYACKSHKAPELVEKIRAGKKIPRASVVSEKQGPQWICPICNKPAPFDSLAVDEYAREILSKTSQSIEQVTIDPSGEWRIPGSEPVDLRDEPANGGGNETNYIVDDEVILSDISIFSGRRTATPSRSLQLPSTPTTGVSREGSTMPRSVASAGTKRSAAVIDLTLSDDDEPSDPPPTKRQNVNGFY
ncbi:uncharacterized protein PgNI_04571 [Pyricularia grisea]|uniref:SAP domain-containing protein n=1 Tax=Pyricularia grisea TaxID=148305 RepID=A0A6P8BCS5_PYRGI|nr:uncharacterized protein PgNI_04571 [Pyricularia grisea]TLD13620.1 hypothetical protein PgNI_04571 [Pyricularia grisea]